MIYNSYDIGTLLVVLLAVVISITLHEFAHAQVAVWNGDNTPKFEGRLTLNPIKHFDPIGFLMLVTAGFGFAKPVPVRPTNFRNIKRGIFTVSIAGITINIILAFISTPLFLVCNSKTQGIDIPYFFANLFYYLMLINVSLALFNLLPLYPLDGFRVVEAFTRYNNKVTKFLREYGYYILIGLIGISLLIDLLNLMRYSEIFYYLDILNLYIRVLGGYIREGFIRFWLLFF